MITASALAATERVLPTFRGPDGDHEGIVFLLGREPDDATIFVTIVAPDADHGEGYVMCSADVVSAAQRAAHRHGLGLLAQVHSHPMSSSRHSIRDDDLVLMPFEGMLSIVVPWYGRFELRPIDTLGVHQYQDGRWASVTRASVREQFLVLPDAIDLR